MTARLRRRRRRREPNHLSQRLAAIRVRIVPELGAIAPDLLGEDRIRKVVAVAILLGPEWPKAARRAVVFPALVARPVG